MGGIRAAGKRTAGEPVKVRTFRRSSVVNMSAPSRLHGRMENAPARSSTSQACRSLSHWCQSCKQPRLRHPLAITPLTTAALPLQQDRQACPTNRRMHAKRSQNGPAEHTRRPPARPPKLAQARPGWHHAAPEPHIQAYTCARGAPLGMCGACASTSPMMMAPTGVRDAGFSTKGHLREGRNDCHVCGCRLCTRHNHSPHSRLPRHSTPVQGAGEANAIHGASCAWRVGLQHHRRTMTKPRHCPCWEEGAEQSAARPAERTPQQWPAQSCAPSGSACVPTRRHQRTASKQACVCAQLGTACSFSST